MGWATLAPPKTLSKGSMAADVTMYVRPAKGVRHPRVVITLRGPLCRELPWLRPNAFVAVELGTERDAGRICIRPDGLHKLKACGPRASANGTVYLSIGLLPGMAAGAQTAVAPEFDYGDDWLQITLPKWALPPATTAFKGALASAGMVTRAEKRAAGSFR